MSKELINILNELLSIKLITDYAVGGSVAAMQYTEPFKTVDLDVFVFLPVYDSKSYMEVIKYLKKVKRLKTVKVKRGNRTYEYVLIDGLPVDFTPSMKPLQDSAVRNATRQKFQGETIKVMTPEYLVALMLDRNDLKDEIRYNMVVEQHGINEDVLLKILKEHQDDLVNLYFRWKSNHENR